MPATDQEDHGPTGTHAGYPPRRGTGRALVICVALAFTVCPPAVAWLLTRDAPQALGDLTPEPVRVVAPVGNSPIDYGAAATLVAEFPDSPTLVSTDLPGTVTDVALAPGSRVAEGSSLYSVDAVQVRAYTGNAVLFRQLGSGDRGADAAALQSFLGGQLGLDLGEDGRIGPATVSAIRAYESAIGISSPSGVFDPAWLVRLATEEFVVAEVKILPGDAAPTRGDVFAVGTTTPEVTVSAASDGPDGPYVFVTSWTELSVARENGEWTISDIAAFLDATENITPTEGRVTLDGRIRIADPEIGQIVPGSALISQDGTTYCVETETGDFPRVEPIEMTIEGGVVIRSSLPEGSRVVVNPSAEDRTTICAST